MAALVLLLLRVGFSSCGKWGLLLALVAVLRLCVSGTSLAVEHWFWAPGSGVVVHGLRGSALHHMESGSGIKTGVPCTAKWIFNHRTPREAPNLVLIIQQISSSIFIEWLLCPRGGLDRCFLTCVQWTICTKNLLGYLSTQTSRRTPTVDLLNPESQETGIDLFLKYPKNHCT